VDGDHELLMLRATMDPRKAKGNEDVGAMRRDRPRWGAGCGDYSCVTRVAPHLARFLATD